MISREFLIHQVATLFAIRRLPGDPPGLTKADYLRGATQWVEGVEALADLAAPAVQAWNLVPTDITEEMHAAAVRTIVRCSGNADFPPRVWRAMLAAAPQAPSVQPNDHDELGALSHQALLEKVGHLAAECARRGHALRQEERNGARLAEALRLSEAALDNIRAASAAHAPAGTPSTGELVDA